MKAKILLTGLALLAMTAFANAQEPVNTRGNGNGNGSGRGTGHGTAFVDTNKNGICDNYENRSATVSGQKKRKRCMQRNRPGERSGKREKFC